MFGLLTPGQLRSIVCVLTGLGALLPALLCLFFVIPHALLDFITATSVPSPSNKYRDRVCKIIEMTGIYPTILKFPELDPDIYLTE